MIEMNETANILNNISERSLILLDEIGRRTSTYDGISIAWANSEYLHLHPTRPKTLFATHYHELNEMTNKFERIKNYTVSVKEVGTKRSEEHTSELQSRGHLVCRLLLEKKKKRNKRKLLHQKARLIINIYVVIDL